MNFLLKISKHKKILIFALLFFVSIGFILPAVVHGSEYWIPVDDWVSAAGGAIKKVAEAAITAPLAAIIMAFGIITVCVFGTLSNLAGQLLLFIMDPSNINGSGALSYTHFTNPIIATGWTTVRDLANMVVVLGFVVIGIATAIRFQDYQAKKLLAPLIIAALLINFSLLICGVIIDGSNILMTAFLHASGFLQQSVGQALGAQIKNIWDNVSFSDMSQLVNLIGTVVGLVFFDLLTAITFFLFFFLFLFRYVFLWILVVLSPLAFVFYVFPFTKKFYSMWWNNFLQWCIIGVPGAFFLYLADQLNDTLTKGPGAAGSSTASGIGAMMLYIVPSVFLIGGFLFSMQSGAMGAGMAVAAFKKTGGAIKELTGRSRAGQAVREGLNNAKARLAERTGFAPVGYAAQQKQKRESEARAQVESLAKSTAKGDQSRYKKLAEIGRGPMGAAAIAVANERGDLASIMGNDLNKVNQRVTYAEQFGHKRSDFEKKNYELAGLNEGKIAKVIGANPGMTQDQAKDMVIKEQLKSNLPQMSTSEIGAINPSHISGPGNYEFVRNNFTPRMIDQMKVSSNPSLIAGMKAHEDAMRDDMMNHVDAHGNITNQGAYNKLNEQLNAIQRLP